MQNTPLIQSLFHAGLIAYLAGAAAGLAGLRSPRVEVLAGIYID